MGKGKGISSSAIPYKRTAPQWNKTTASEVNTQVCQLARKGYTPSQIGVILRDSYGIPQVKRITGSTLLRLLKANGLAPKLPKHLERNRKDKDSKFRLILIESRVHRLARYYRRVNQLPPNWKYDSATASAWVA